MAGRADPRSGAEVDRAGGRDRRHEPCGPGRVMAASPEERDALTRRIAPDVKLGKNVKIFAFVNLYGCAIGDESLIGTFVEIQKGVRVGARCKIQSHTFICEGVTIEDEVFVGHNVNFLNDRWPSTVHTDGSLTKMSVW